MRNDSSRAEEFVTIIASSTAEAMHQFKAQGLDSEGFTIAGRVGRHRFVMAAGESGTDLFEGSGMVAAIFSRRVTPA